MRVVGATDRAVVNRRAELIIDAAKIIPMRDAAYGDAPHDRRERAGGKEKSDPHWAAAFAFATQ